MTAPNRINGYDRDQRFRMCRKKIRWTDELTARAAGLISLENMPRGVEKLWTYRCPICRGIHLTKKKQHGQEPIMLQKEALAA